MGRSIGLFFGSFNPIHVGHLIIANHMVENTELQEVWFVVSPQNPFKQKSNLLDAHQRLHLVELAIEGDHRLRASRVEFDLPVPSYTVDTLAVLEAKHPRDRFALLMGSDNLQSIDRWKNYEVLLKRHRLLVYPRPGFEATEWINHPAVEIQEVPLLQVSASFIRHQIREGKSVRYLLSDPVWRYVDQMNYYREPYRPGERGE
jgi:nicotinate-nucleotide adenylyltransferase